mmetsp:Transcript_24943/g.40396  ORF Transcript_24943/g.40396 Transcript_24943/m.40396 type:complete len:290 (+) Transcript_24943:407-1276(+)
MASASSPNDTLQLIGLDPQHFLFAVKAPSLHAFTRSLHHSASHPQEQQTIVVGELSHIHVEHLFVGECAVRQLHMNIPRRIRHNHTKLAEHRKIKCADITIHPLRGVTMNGGVLIDLFTQDLSVHRLWILLLILLTTICTIRILIRITIHIAMLRIMRWMRRRRIRRIHVHIMLLLLLMHFMLQQQFIDKLSPFKIWTFACHTFFIDHVMNESARVHMSTSIEIRAIAERRHGMWSHNAHKMNLFTFTQRQQGQRWIVLSLAHLALMLRAMLTKLIHCATFTRRIQILD